MILLDLHIIAPGPTVNTKLGNPQPFKHGVGGSQNSNAEKPALQPVINGG